jgi:antitoxin YefM
MTAAITATEARRRFFPLLKQVAEDHVHVEIVYVDGNAVLVSKEDWDAMVETAYLSRGANGEQLRASIAELEAGKAVVRDLVDE